MSILNYLANSPLRTPDWRWHRAVASRNSEGVATTRRRDGTDGFAWINRAIKFGRRLDNCVNDQEKATLAMRDPAIFWAHWIWTNPSPLKHSVEARLLARQGDAEIGQRCNLSPESVNAYEAIFFNVRDKLQHTSYILNCAIGSALHRGITEREYDLLWKLYGYFIGPFMLDALESKFSKPVWCSTVDEVHAAVMDDAISTLKLKSLVAAKTVGVNQHTQLALLEQFTKFVEVERNSDARDGDQQINENISAMFVAMPITVGERDPRGTAIQNPTIQEFNRSAIELTYEETMRLSTSQTIANESILRKLEFPVTQATQRMED